MSRNLMKFAFRSVFAGAALLCLLFGGGVHAVDARSVVRIAVMDFSVNGVAPHLGQATGELLRTYFSGAGGMEVVERAQMEALAREQKLHLSGMVDQSTAVKAGRLLGASYIVVGSVNAFGSALVLTARVIDVQGSRSISGFDKRSRSGEEGLYDIAVELAAEILSRMTPESPTSAPTPAPAVRTPAPAVSEPLPLPPPQAPAFAVHLQWDLSKEHVALRDERKKFSISTVKEGELWEVPKGWYFRFTAFKEKTINLLDYYVVPKQALPVPSTSRRLGRWEVEAEVSALSSRWALAGVYLGNAGVDIVFTVRDSRAVLFTNVGVYSENAGSAFHFFPHADTSTSHWSRVKVSLEASMGQPLSPPAKLKLVYDQNTGEIAGYVNGVRVIESNIRDNMLPRLSSVTHAGVCMGSIDGQGHGVFSTLEFRGR